MPRINAEDFEALFSAVREACGPRVWSQGVQISRDDGVQGDSVESDQIKLRVADRESGFSPEVQLFPMDEDWSCSCSSPEDPCHHVAAAVIALRRAQERGEDLPTSSKASAFVSYQFKRQGEELSFIRHIEVPGEQQPTVVEGSLSLLSSHSSLSPTQDDLQVESALVSEKSGILRAQIMPNLFRALEPSDNVYLDGKKLKANGKPIGVRIYVDDEAAGVRVYGKQDPDITELFGNGIALCGDVLRPVKLPRLSPPEQDLVRNGKHFSAAEFAQLAGEILPSLSDHMPIEIRTDRLPQKSHARPRVELSAESRGETLEVVPSIVYGDPPVARVKDGHLIALGSEVPIRNTDEEHRLRDALWQDLGLELNLKVTFTGPQAVQMVDKINRWDGDVRSRDLDRFKMFDELLPVVQIKGQDFKIEFMGRMSDGSHRSAEGGPRVADPERVMQAWRENESMVPLAGGGWAPLPTDWLSRFGDRILDLMAAKQVTKKLPKAALPALAELADDLGERNVSDLDRFKQLAFNFDGIPAIELPDSVQATLRPYQKTGVDWLSLLKSYGIGAMLADDMGLGKTLQTLCVVSERTLVVAPTSVLPNWQAEIEKFRPDLSSSIFHGTNRELDPKADVVITSYAVLRLDVELLASEEWDMVVLDEAQTIKNPDSQVTQAALQLEARFRVTLSGTPVENSLEDLWSQFNFINPGFLGPRKFFNEAYARPINIGKDEVAKRLRQRLKPFLMRRLKKDVASELPPRTEVVLYAELSQHERKIYDAVAAATRKDVINQLEGGGNVIEALEMLLRLRQACCHPSLVPGQSGESSAKLTLLIERLTEALTEGHKALIFSQWTSFLDLIEPVLKRESINYLRLDGSTTNRGEIVEQFQTDDSIQVLVMSLKAGGVGLNLTAADHIFLMDPWWNPAAEDQATDRAYRIGQDKPVLVHRVVTTNTIEGRILELQKHKRKLSRDVVSATEGSYSLTREELLDLIK